MAANAALHAILFDDGLGDLGPLSDLRCAFEQRTAGRTLLERARAHGLLGALAAPAGAAELLAARHGLPVNPAQPGAALLLNGRLHAPLLPALIADLAALGPGEALLGADGTPLALRLDAPAAARAVAAIAAGAPGTPAAAQALAGLAARSRPSALALWRRPWDLLEAGRFGALLAADIDDLAATWAADARQRIPAHAALVGAAPVHVHASAQIGIGVVLDATDGPILVAEGAQVRHGSVLTGPVFVGTKCIVADRSVLKARTALGPQCRAAGEIGSVLFQGCSNKAHDGHLGDALVGEWVNLGASTVNSNLLNTYGEVAMRLRPEGALERTGRQFMGCILGDHAKTAIGTRIMTGSSAGTGTMWAATAPISGTVPAFSWVTDEGRRSYRAEKFLEVARTVMARRGVAPSPAEEARLRALAGARA